MRLEKDNITFLLTGFEANSTREVIMIYVT
jgi:hypothetical protein